MPENLKSTSINFEISDEAQKITSTLTSKIKSVVVENGEPIDFERFMQMALYEPQLGYYQNSLYKFGEKGDFITAPEMGNLFANCIANSVSSYIKNHRSHSILEIGAGSGQLAVDIILSLKQKNSLPKNYFILEPSPTLQSQQKNSIKQHCSGYINKVVWLSALPIDFEGIIIANEVIDAIPCQIIEKTDNGWFYHGIDINNDQLQTTITNKVPSSELPNKLKSKEYIVGYQTEIRKQVSGWLSSLSQCLLNGHLLLIDYGYSEKEFFHPQRTQGTLTCFINHHRHCDYTQAVGIQDITAHVNFTEVAKIADKNHLRVSGYTTQASFLLENDIIKEAEAQSKELETVQNSTYGATIARYKTSQQIQKLIMPGQMGEVIKVMGLTKKQDSQIGDVKNTIPLIKGFSMQDQLHHL